jgi:prepilin-type processing-associated H-X9-DG protein
MRRFGFSRWELLVLGAVFCAGGALLPVLAQTIDAKREQQNRHTLTCMSNLKSLALGLHLYMDDYDKAMPRVALHSQAAPYPNSYGWADATVPYLRTLDFFQCPAESRKGRDNPLKPGFTDYWLNTNMSGVSFTDTKAPTRLIMLGDGDGGSNSNARYNLNKLPKSWIVKPGSPARRHQDKACYAFFDGHVKKMAPSQVGKPNAKFALK